MLGLASITSAMLAGVAAASNALTFCSASSSHTRKSSWVSPRTRAPSGAVTVHCTSTSATRERMTGAGAGAAESSPGSARISPVAGSREMRISRSSMRGLGSLCFCAAVARDTASGRARVETRSHNEPGRHFASNLIKAGKQSFYCRTLSRKDITRDRSREPAFPPVPRAPSSILLQTCERGHLLSCFRPPRIHGTYPRAAAPALKEFWPHRKYPRPARLWAGQYGKGLPRAAHPPRASIGSRGRRPRWVRISLPWPPLYAFQTRLHGDTLQVKKGRPKAPCG